MTHYDKMSSYNNKGDLSRTKHLNNFMNKEGVIRALNFVTKCNASAIRQLLVLISEDKPISSDPMVDKYTKRMVVASAILSGIATQKTA